MATIEHRYAQVNGVRLHYAVAGSGERLIIFLHGFPEFWYEWKDQLEEFGGQFTCVAPDMRGYNLSEKPAALEQYEVPKLVEDVRALAEHLGRRRFVLVAHDWGGLVAWAFAMFHPDLLEKLILINIPHPTPFLRELQQSRAQQEASAYMLRFRTPGAEVAMAANNYAGLVQAVLAKGLQQGHFTEVDRAAYLEAWSQPGALTGGLNYYRAARIGPPSAADPLGGGDLKLPDPTVVRVPTLVIWGEQDTALLLGCLDGTEDVVPGVTIKRIPEGSHWVVHEFPALVNSYIREFIET